MKEPTSSAQSDATSSPVRLRFPILAADALEKAMDYVRQITNRGDRIPLFLVDQRMPQMSGVGFVQLDLSPPAWRPARPAHRLRRFRTAAIAAIDKVKHNYYLMKPWVHTQ